MDYLNIAKAVAFYSNRGYVYTPDAPWIVDKAPYHTTKPKGAVDVIYTEANRSGDSTQHLVASGEQSFVAMMLDGQPLKRAICVTPCFRVENYNDWHRPYFIKAELINAHDVDEAHLVHMIHDACAFFESVGLSVRLLKTGRSDLGEPSYDIVEKSTRVELGSYGIRRTIVNERRLDWIYGTACAEPRLSTVLQRHLRVDISGR